MSSAERTLYYLFLCCLAHVGFGETPSETTVQQVFVITVVNENGNVFAIDAVNKPILNILRSGVYTFDQSHSSNAGHQIAFKDSTGTSYTTGVTTTGTPGTSGAQTVFTVDADAPDNLLYYCVAHGNSMGNNILVSTPCRPGHYSELFQNVITCKRCPYGTYNNDTGSLSVESCKLCPIGKYSSDWDFVTNQVYPESGVVGNEMPGFTRCVDCPLHSTSDPLWLFQNPSLANGIGDTREQQQCTCNAGYAQAGYDVDYQNYELSAESDFRVFNELCVACYANTYQPVTATFRFMTISEIPGECLQCAAGKFSNPGSASCGCAAGQYSNNETGGVCLSCPTGETSTAGAATCDAPPETTPQATTPQATTPQATTPQATTPPETTPPETTPPETTPPETTPPETTPPETTPPETTPQKVFYPLLCVACPAGFFLEQESLNCTECPPGSSTHDFSNASSALDCLCGPRFDNQTDACQLCKEGFYKQSLENISCASCPANSSTAFPGALNESECVCKPGYTQRSLESSLSTTPTPTPTPAPAPTLQFFFRVGESPYGWQEAYDEAVAAGRRLPTIDELRAYIISNPSVFTQFDTLDRWTPVVNPGVANTKDFVQIGDWVHDGVPYYRGLSLIQNRPYPWWADDSTFEFMKVYTEVLETNPPETAVLIWKNEYNESLTNDSLSNASLYDASYNAWDLEKCVACPAGTYKTPLGAGSCVPCPADHYCPPASAEPRVCPPSSSSLPGSGAPEACLCSDGLVLLPGNGTYKCEECHADTYYARDPATSVGICLACQPGAGSPSGSRSERNCVCKPGFVVRADAPGFTCAACSSGTYSAAANASVCDACAPGTFAASVGASLCATCPSGSVALASGMSACVPCPPSTWQDVELSGHLSAPCAPCPENSNHELVGVYDVRKCVCAAGLYKAMNETPGAKGFVCSSCQPGFQCAAQTSSTILQVTLVIDMSISDFTPALQQMYIESVAHTTGVEPESVRIASITEHFGRRLLSFLRRLLSGDVEVEFEITYLNVNNASAVTVPTLEQFSIDAEERYLPSVILVSEFQITVYDQRIPCETGNFCAGGENVFSCPPFSSSIAGAQTQAQCACVPGFYSLINQTACNKCPPSSFCPGGAVVESCAENSTSAPGAASPDGCFCREGHWRGCTRTDTGAFINNTGQPCAINFTAPCVQCRANDICFNDTLLHCPAHSTSPAGSSQPSHCVCEGGFAEEHL